jgi:hypothetical protein
MHYAYYLGETWLGNNVSSISGPYIVFGVYWNSSRHMLSTRGLERYMVI